MLQCELLCVRISGSGFDQWVWILAVVLDFYSGSGLPVGLDMKTAWARLPAVACDLHTTMAYCFTAAESTYPSLNTGDLNEHSDAGY